MEQRRKYRRRRRSRLRYRQARFLNRRRRPGWLPPSVKSRLDNTLCWITRLAQIIAAHHVDVETTQFDIQRLRNPGIQGKEYQQGPLYQTTLRAYIYHRDADKPSRHPRYTHQTTLRAYIYHRDSGRCQYCSRKPTKDNRLTLDHIIPRAAGGANTPDNIVAACRKCNVAKGDKPVEQFLSRKPSVLSGILAQLKKPLASAAHVNVIIPNLIRQLHENKWAITEHDAAQTTTNRRTHNISKTHANDAALLGYCIIIANLPDTIRFQATGHGQRQRMTPNKKGTPKGKAWPAYCRARDLGLSLPKQIPGHKQRQVRFPGAKGVSTGDLVEITNWNGKHIGYAELYGKGTRIKLQGTDPNITGKVSTARVIRRNHGYRHIVAEQHPHQPIST